MRRVLLGVLALVVVAAGCTGDEADVPVAAPSAEGPAPVVGPTDPPPMPSSDAAAATGAPAAWQPLPPAPLALTEVASTAHAGEVWTAGGLTADGQASTAVLRYSPVTGEWGRGPDLPVAVHHAALVSTGPTVLLLGGYEGADFTRPTEAVWVLESEEVGWQPGAPLPLARAAGAAGFADGLVVYGGGVGPDGLAGDVYLGGANGWTIGGVLLQPREHLAAAGIDGVVVFMGGRTGGLDSNLGHVEVVAVTPPDGASITSLGPVLPPAGGVAGFTHPDGRACMAGGEEPAVTIATVACVDRSGAVEELPPMSTPRHGLGAAVVDGVAHIVLGGPDPGLFTSDAGEALPL